MTSEIMCTFNQDILQRYTKKVLLKAGEPLKEADLIQANLIDAGLKNANLKGASLKRANLFGANLFGANLFGANLFAANLREANLVEANLIEANLTGVDLINVKLRNTKGNGREIISITLEEYKIVYTKDTLQIGCENHSIEDWFGFNDNVIDDIDKGLSLTWWNKHKEFIKQSIERNPAI